MKNRPERGRRGMLLFTLLVCRKEGIFFGEERMIVIRSDICRNDWD